MGFEIKLSNNYKAANVKRIGGFIVTRNWQNCEEEQVKIAKSFDPKGNVYQVQEVGWVAPVGIVERTEPEIEKAKPEVEISEIIPDISTEIEIETAPHIESSTKATLKHSKPQKKKKR